MEVYKFGGTSQKDYSTLLQCANILSQNNNKKSVVVSAPAGITNLLLAAATEHNNSNIFPENTYNKIANIFQEIYAPVSKANALASNLLLELEKNLRISTNHFSEREKEKHLARILSFGENAQATLFTYFLKENGINAARLPQKMIRMSGNYTRAKYERKSDAEIKKFTDQNEGITVLGGFYGFNDNNEEMTLERGGSDLTQTEHARATDAEVCYNYTDVDGVKQIDPKLVPENQRLLIKTIDELSYWQAQELSSKGAKVLDSRCIEPLIEKNIPLYVINTLNPDGPKTRISNKITNESKLLAVTGKKDAFITVTLNSGNMEGTSGYISAFANAFKDVDIDTITTSRVEIGASFSDPRANIDSIKKELSNLGTVRVNNSTSLVAIVGENIGKNPKLIADFFRTLSEENISVQQITKSNDHSLWISIPSKSYEPALRAMHSKLLN